VALFTEMQVREDGWTLFGFPRWSRRNGTGCS
jgi:Holliday junction resolvasome RuvABC DNA-binding subunit